VLPDLRIGRRPTRMPDLTERIDALAFHISRPGQRIAQAVLEVRH
jgi:hypothetical protein